MRHWLTLLLFRFTKESRKHIRRSKDLERVVGSVGGSMAVVDAWLAQAQAQRPKIYVLEKGPRRTAAGVWITEPVGMHFIRLPVTTLKEKTS